MPSIPSHALVSIAIGTTCPVKEQKTKFLLLCALCGIFPDFDTIGMWMGIPYESTFGHRGFMHSILFALIVACFITLTAYRKSRQQMLLYFYFFIATLSHPLLDAMTSGGLGVAFFSPFSNERYFFPFRPIKVSHIGLQAFIRHNGLAVLKNEFVWMWLPSFALIGIMAAIKKLTNSRSTTSRI